VLLRERTGAQIYGHAALAGVDVVLADGQEVDLSGWRVRALETPGHADDHLCFWVPDGRLLFAGDLVAGQGTIVLADRPGALGQYMESLERMLALGPSTILAGHGPVVQDGPAKLREYVEHRLARERQIVAALADGPLTVGELVARIYVETPPGLLPMAARNVRAHLERLAGLGSVAPDGEGWRIG
jgi:glyoxylase-like metal-dependent hydrolase (beta-lactamase superfamily II)